MINLYTEAGKLTKPISKKQAEAIVLELFTRNPDEAGDLSKLLKFFMPTKSKAKTLEAWVASAVAVKDIRNYLRFVHCDGGTMVATDGTRLHGAPSQLPAGLYDPVSMQKVWELGDPAGPGKYPDWRRIVPTRDTVAVDSVSLLYVDKVNISFQHGAILSKFIAYQITSAVERCDRVSVIDDVCSAYLEGPEGAFAIVMPLRKPRK